MKTKQTYWLGKTRDPLTMKKLVESKYKVVWEYDSDGSLVKPWESAISTALWCYDNGKRSRNACKTLMNQVLGSEYFGRHLKAGSYWFREADLIAEYGEVPMWICVEEKLVADKLLLHQRRKAGQANKVVRYKTKYEVIETRRGKTIRYDDVGHCAAELGLGLGTVKSILTGRNSKKYDLRYGKKVKRLLIP